MPVGQAADYFQSVFEAFNGMPAPKQDAELLNYRLGDLGKIGKSTLLDASAIAIGFAKQHGRGRITIGYGVDIHDHCIAQLNWFCKG